MEEDTGELSISPLTFRVTFRPNPSCLCPRIISQDVSLPQVSEVVAKAWKEAVLEEVEFLGSNFDLDFSLQPSLKRVAITSSMISQLPKLSNLEELVLTDLKEVVTEISRFSRVSRLTLSGAFDALSAQDLSNFTLAEIHLEITSPSQRPLETRRGDSLAVSPFSLPRASLVVGSITLDDTWTNESLANTLCAQNYDELLVQCVATKWFRLPSCVSLWPTLARITITSCQMPNFTALPPSLTFISVTNAYGSWSKFDAGVSLVSDPTSDYFDWTWLSRLPALLYLTFDGPLSGTLPNDLSHAKLIQLGVQATLPTSRVLVGSISPNWFRQYPAMISLTLVSQNLTGTIPYWGYEKVLEINLSQNKFTHWPPLIVNTTSGFGPPSSLRTLSLSNNNLVQIPMETDFQSMPLSYFDLTSNPNLSAPFPNVFIGPAHRTYPLKIVYASNCRFYGPLPEIPASQLSSYEANSQLAFRFGDNDFNGTIPSSWSQLKMNSLQLNGNPRLTGAVATIDENGMVVSQLVKDVTVLSLQGTNLNGPMFNISAMPSLAVLIMGSPGIDFCSASRFGFSYATTPGLSMCSLVGNATMCGASYPSACSLWASPPQNEAQEPESQISNPKPDSMPDLGCPLPSPGSTFVCTNGVWVSIGPVTETIISLPPASITIVNGNLSTNSIVFASTSSTINVTGCITTLDGKTPRIVVILTQADLEEIVKLGGIFENELIRQGEGCHAISASAVEIDSSGIKSCKTVKTDKIGSPSGLAITFRVNTSKCNVWWIVLVSVLCVVAIVVVVVVIVVFKVLDAKKLEKERHRLE